MDASVDWKFGQRIFAIMGMVTVWPCAGLLALSILDAVIVSRVGQVAGSFYSALISGNLPEFRVCLATAAGLYLAATAISSTTQALIEWLAWHWRCILTHHIMSLYCQNMDVPSAAGLDNPDQRIAQDLPQLCTYIASAAKDVVSVPMQVMLYCILTTTAFSSWIPAAIAAAFFVLGCLLQRVVMEAVARLVYLQEQKEGYLRALLFRLSTHWQPICMWRGEAAEQAAVAQRLAAATDNQRQLVLRRWSLTASTRALEYSGSMLNYCCLGLAAFTGWIAGGLPAEASERAAAVSNRSFFLLTLIYSLTRILDLAKDVSTLAGLTARVMPLIEHLEAHDAQRKSRTGESAPKKRPHHRIGMPRSAWQGQAPISLTTPLLYAGSLQGAANNLRDIQGHEDFSGGYAGGQAADGTHIEQQQQQQQRDCMQEVGEQAAASTAAASIYSSQEASVQAVAGQARRHDTGTQQQATQAHGNRQIPPLLSTTTHGGSCWLDQGTADLACKLEGEHSVSAPAAPTGVDGSGAEGTQFQLQAPNPNKYASAATLVVSPTSMVAGEDDEMEVSVHAVQLASPLHSQLLKVFPDAPASLPLLAVVTFQFADTLKTAPPGASSTNHLETLDHDHTSPTPSLPHLESAAASDDAVRIDLQDGAFPLPSSAASPAAMNHMLRVFLQWQEAVHCELSVAGHWCDSVDPLSGYPVRGQRRQGYSEVLGVQVFLGYRGQHEPSGSLVAHPCSGLQCYPATLFTTAPLPAVRAALAAVTHCPYHPPRPASPLDFDRTLLEMRDVEVRTRGGRLVVSGLNLRLQRGAGLLLTGPSSAGKSTLVASLSGLHPLAAGSVRLPPQEQVVVVSQQILMAPGSSLGHQLAYPDPTPLPPALVTHLLQAVCLEHLLTDGEGGHCRTEGLSHGEMQRLALARVLHRRPLLAVLDEASSAMSAGTEETVLQRIVAAGTTLVCVAHRPAAPHLHSLHLHITGDGNGTWSLTSAQAA